MTSMLILLFLYLGIMALQNAIRDPRPDGPRRRPAGGGGRDPAW